jgi:hypothetical protein
MTAAAATVAFVPAIAASNSPDPIFGRIDALKTAEARIDALRDIDARETYEAAWRAADAAFDELTEIPPTTIPGIRALLEFLDEWCGGNNGDCYDYSLLLRSPVLAVTACKPIVTIICVLRLSRKFNRSFQLTIEVCVCPFLFVKPRRKSLSLPFQLRFQC